VTGGASARLAVLGSPIAHSKSPLLHHAAYSTLGLDWQYGRHEVDERSLGGFLDDLTPEWRGLSLTMPLKEVVIPRLASIDEVARATGAVNTVLLSSDGWRGWNTDVDGIVRAFAERGIARAERVVLLGTGATARSALVAFQRMGARDVVVSGRSPERMAETVAFARSLDLDARSHPEGLDWTRWPDGVDLVTSTLPSGAVPALPAAPGGVALLDAAYAGSPLSHAWRAQDPDAPVVEGIDMLVHQALLQVRVFVNGDVDVPLTAEDRVYRAMRAAVEGS
jgi:shikimate dehydrogenase